MTHDKVAHFEQLAESAVGPAPWYWRAFPTFTLRGRTMGWQLLVEGDHAHRPALCEVPNGVPLLVLNIYCRVLRADPGYAMLWYPLAPAGPIEVTILALEDLTPVSGATKENAESAARKAGVFSPSAARESIRIPEGLTAGRHLVPALRFADTLDEVFLLADGPPAEDRLRSPATSIYVWRPGAGNVEVLPQTWFTGADFDLDYQWITGVARDPGTGRLVGSGIRLGIFELADSGAEVLRWWTKWP